MEQKKKEKLKITAVVMYAWYLGACGYCSEAWILCVVEDPYVRVLGGCLLLGAKEGGFYGGGSLRGCQRFRSGIRFGFRLSGCLRQTLCGCEIFQVCLRGVLFYGSAVFA